MKKQEVDQNEFRIALNGLEFIEHRLHHTLDESLARSVYRLATLTLTHFLVTHRNAGEASLPYIKILEQRFGELTDYARKTFGDSAVADMPSQPQSRRDYRRKSR